MLALHCACDAPRTRESRLGQETAIANLKHGVIMQEAVPTLIGSRYPVKFTILQRFNQKWHPANTSDCHFWLASTTRGYGKMSLRGGRRNEITWAHRLSWELKNGPIPRGLHVLHKCDTPACVNPEHLFLGTHLDNIQDCIHKGRHAKGQDLPQAKLTERHVIEIRRSPLKQAEAALKYGVAPSSISFIRSRRSWKHVP